MTKQIFRYSGYTLLVTFILLCFMPQAEGPTNPMPPATYLMTNISALALLTTAITGIILLIAKLKPAQSKPETF